MSSAQRRAASSESRVVRAVHGLEPVAADAADELAETENLRRSLDRDALRAYLAERGIGTQIHYPVPIHLQEAAQFLGYRKGDLPITERLAGEQLSIPIYPEMTDEMTARVASTITEFMRA